MISGAELIFSCLRILSFRHFCCIYSLTFVVAFLKSTLALRRDVELHHQSNVYAHMQHLHKAKQRIYHVSITWEPQLKQCAHFSAKVLVASVCNSGTVSHP